MRRFLSKAPGGFTFFNSSLLFLIWRRNWRNCWVPLQEPWVELIFFYFGEGMEMVRGSAVLYFLLLWLLFIFWDFWQMCCRSVGIKAGRWEHPDLNIDLTHKAEQIAHWSISPDVFSPGHTSRQRCSRLRRLSVCTYNTIFLLDPSAPQLQPPELLPVLSLTLMYMLGCLLGRGTMGRSLHIQNSCIVTKKERNCASARVDFVPVQLEMVYETVKTPEGGREG